MASLSELGLKLNSVPGPLQKIAEDYRLSQTVVIPAGKSVIHTSGHVGLDENGDVPKDIEAEIFNVFKNIETSLKAAGAKNGFKSVYQMTTYHTAMDEKYEAALEKAHLAFTGSDKPAWTGVTVVSLSEGVHMEMQVQAIVD